jgi:hypothetical protein
VRKSILFCAITFFAAHSAFATYYIVLRDGTKYRAKDKWVVVNGKALITLDNGTQFTIDPSLIDAAKTDQFNKSGLGDATLLATGQPSQSVKTPETSSLGDLTRNRRAPVNTVTPATRPGTTPPPAGPGISSAVLARISPVYENVGLYGAKATSPGPATIHVDLVADSEDQVFKAISATAYILMKLPTVTGARIDNIELNMATIKGGAAGRFNMNAADAQALESRQMQLSKYYVDKVIF